MLDPGTGLRGPGRPSCPAPSPQPREGGPARPAVPGNPARRLALLAPLLLGGCASGLRIYADDVPHGALRLGEVVALASRGDIRSMPGTYQALLASGIQETAIRDRSLGEARVFCCGGPVRDSENLYFYIPPGLKLRPGDIVEIRSGTPGAGGRPGIPSTAVRVVQKRGAREPRCRWDPPIEHYWQTFQGWKRILYCDWMPQEGWIEPLGAYPVWFKK